MQKWIRWWGLIAFGLLVILIFVFWLFFVDGMVRRAVERTGTSLAGAEVNIARAHLTISPLGIALSGIQVTDPKAPSTNSVEIARIACSLDALNLLRRKVIIRETAAEGVRFGTARKRPGFVAAPDGKTPREEKPSTLAFPSFDMPDVGKILATESFGSVKLIDDARANLQRTRDDWQKRIRELPNKASVEAYRTRLAALGTTARSGWKGLAGAAGDAGQIKDDINRDLDLIKKSRAALDADLSSAKDLVAKAEQAPQEDIRRIGDRYGISPSGLRNMSQALFGGKIASWFGTGLYWYNRISPLVSGARDKKENVRVVKPIRGKGVDVKFPETRPLPDFLIRTLNASLQPDAGSFSGRIRNITPDQDIIAEPLTFLFHGSGMKDVRTISVAGILDHIRPTSIHDSLRLRADGYRVGGMILSENTAFPVSLQGGQMDIDFTGVRGPDGFKATLVTPFRSVRINTGTREGGGAIAAALRSALSHVSSFTLTADIAGVPGNYTVKVSSDLDRVFQNAIGQIVQQQRAKLEKELRAAIQAKTGEKLRDLKASLGGLNSLGGEIDGLQNQLNALLRDAAPKVGGKIPLPF